MTLRDVIKSRSVWLKISSVLTSDYRLVYLVRRYAVAVLRECELLYKIQEDIAGKLLEGTESSNGELPATGPIRDAYIATISDFLDVDSVLPKATFTAEDLLPYVDPDGVFTPEDMETILPLLGTSVSSVAIKR